MNSLTYIKWLENYINFGKKCMKLESINGVTDNVKSIGEIYAHNRLTDGL
jgi:hypothetical protein